MPLAIAIQMNGRGSGVAEKNVSDIGVRESAWTTMFLGPGM